MSNNIFREGDMEEFDHLDQAPDWTNTLEFDLAMAQVGKAIRSRKEVNIGQLSRMFPQHVPILITILEKLQQRGSCWWDDYKPMPTRVYAGDRRIDGQFLSRKEANDRTYKQEQPGRKSKISIT